MGASDFFVTSTGASPKEAFTRAVQEARYWHGHGGYTGTIAEKSEFVLIAVPEGQPPKEYAQRLVSDGDRRVDDKWGPAGCVLVSPGTYYFFGCASD